MSRRARRHHASILWLACYVLSLFCVVSFIAFEVLDLDGSDFTPTSHQAGFKPAESEHADVRRVIVAATITVVGGLDAGGLSVDQPCREHPTSRPPAPRWRPARPMLARASLGDVPPAA